MSIPSRAPRFPIVLWFALGALLGALVLAPAATREAGAEPAGAAVTQFLSITGEGPTAKAWYEGAQPAGVPVQRALQTFNDKGFRVVRVTEPHPSKAGQGEFVWSILMERGR